MNDKAIEENQDARSRTPRSSWSGSWASIRDLEVFRTILEQRGVTLAAKKLNVSQPAVSRTLSLLEERSGRQFFEREGNQLIPTSDGLKLYEVSDPLFSALDKLVDFRWLLPDEGHINIAVAPTIAHCFMPLAIAKFRELFPTVKVTMEIKTTSEVLTSVAAGIADVGIAEVLPGDWGFEQIAFRKSKLCAALPKKHPLGQKSSLKASDMNGLPVVALVKTNQIRAAIDRMLWNEGALPNIVAETTDALSAIELVENNVGIAIVNPFPVMINRDTKVDFIPLLPAIEYTTSIITNSSKVSKSLVKAFIDILWDCQPKDDQFSIRCI